MPTYQYKREDGSVFEVIQKMSDDALTSCPETGQSVKRVITGGSGVVYKGDGWYVTDYKNKGKNGSNGTNSNGSAEKSNGSASSESTTAKTATENKTA